MWKFPDWLEDYLHLIVPGSKPENAKHIIPYIENMMNGEEVDVRNNPERAIMLTDVRARIDVLTKLYEDQGEDACQQQQS